MCRWYCTVRSVSTLVEPGLLKECVLNSMLNMLNLHYNTEQ